MKRKIEIMERINKLMEARSKLSPLEDAWHELDAMVLAEFDTLFSCDAAMTQQSAMSYSSTGDFTHLYQGKGVLSFA